MTTEGWAALGVVLSGIIAAAGVQIVKIINARGKTQTTAERTTVAGLWQIIESLKSELTARRDENEECERRTRALERFRNRAETWIETAQDAMRDKGIKFRPWSATPSDESHEHKRLT